MTTTTAAPTDLSAYEVATQEFINDNSDCYELEDMIEFIQEHGEANFIAFYDDYIIYAEKLGRDGYEILDAFVLLMGGFHDINKAEEMYRGEYRSDAAFAEDHYEQLGVDIPNDLVVDWDATFDSSLRYDFSESNSHYFFTSF